MDLESLLILLPATGGVTPGALDCALLQALANRHGLITGASGTGKTLTCRGCGSCAG
jgi:Cdc6-like AAA superfamily ATPase